MLSNTGLIWQWRHISRLSVIAKKKVIKSKGLPGQLPEDWASGMHMEWWGSCQCHAWAASPSSYTAGASEYKWKTAPGRKRSGFQLDWLSDLTDHKATWEQEFAERHRLQSLEGTVLKQLWKPHPEAFFLFLNKKVQDNQLNWKQLKLYLCTDTVINVK